MGFLLYYRLGAVTLQLSAPKTSEGMYSPWNDMFSLISFRCFTNFTRSLEAMRLFRMICFATFHLKIVVRFFRNVETLLGGHLKEAKVAEKKGCDRLQIESSRTYRPKYPHGFQWERKISKERKRYREVICGRKLGTLTPKKNFSKGIKGMVAPDSLTSLGGVLVDTFITPLNRRERGNEDLIINPRSPAAPILWERV